MKASSRTYKAISEKKRRDYANCEGIAGYVKANHLGNVLTTISDKKIMLTRSGAVHNSGTRDAYSMINGYQPEVVSISDYTATGMVEVGRSFSLSDDSSFDYGFNGKYKDNDIEGAANIYDYGFRMYDPRLGRFVSVDPLRRKYPYLSTYQFTADKFIEATDMDGLEPHDLNSSGGSVNGPYSQDAVGQMDAAIGAPLPEVVVTATVPKLDRNTDMGQLPTVNNKPSFLPQTATADNTAATSNNTSTTPAANPNNLVGIGAVVSAFPTSPTPNLDLTGKVADDISTGADVGETITVGELSDALGNIGNIAEGTKVAIDLGKVHQTANSSDPNVIAAHNGAIGQTFWDMGLFAAGAISKPIPIAVSASTIVLRITLSDPVKQAEYISTLKYRANNLGDKAAQRELDEMETQPTDTHLEPDYDH